MILRELNNSDVSGMLDWMHDDSVNKFFRFKASSATEEAVQKFIDDSKKLFLYFLLIIFSIR